MKSKVLFTSVSILIIVSIAYTVLNHIFKEEIDGQPTRSEGDRYYDLYNTSTGNDCYNDSLTFERRQSCHLRKRSPCRKSNKSLVITFWSEKSRSRWVSQNILTAFPSDSFDHIVFVFDNSTWNGHPAYQQSIFIHVDSQIRFWFVKRFVPTTISKQYRYIWILDDDAQLTFDPKQYECVVDRLSISLSSPSRMKGAWRHEVTSFHADYIDRIGRWTDFVEIGPIFVASSEAWSCIDYYLDEVINWGWGLDMIWCKMLSTMCFSSNRENVCAVLDVFNFIHQSETVNSGQIGWKELSFYEKFYPSLQSERKTYGPLARDVSVIKMCN